MICVSWVSSTDPPTVNIPQTLIQQRGFDLSNYDGGVSFLLVGSGISTLIAYPDSDETGQTLEVHRNAVFDFEQEKDQWGWLDKKIVSFSVTFG